MGTGHGSKQLESEEPGSQSSQRSKAASQAQLLIVRAASKRHARAPCTMFAAALGHSGLQVNTRVLLT